MSGNTVATPTDEKIREFLDSLPVEQRAIAQGYLELCGYRQTTQDTHTCQRCGYSYQVRRRIRFLPDMTTEYFPAPDPGCQRCAEKSHVDL